MERKHLIIVAVIVFALVGCACAGAATLLILRPLDDTGTTPTGGDPAWTPPITRGPVQNTNVPSYTDARVPGTSPTPLQSQSALDFAIGAWQCVQTSAQIGDGWVLQFMPSTGGAAGLAYMSDDPQREGSWTEFAYQFGVEGSVTMYPTQVPEGRMPVTTRLWIQFPDENTLLVYSAAEGDEALAPAVLVRLQ